MAPADRILLAWGPGEIRSAVCRGDQIVELGVARAELVAGALFLGRVVEVPSGLDAAFVEIGQSRPGFLPGAKGRCQGQSLLVQVRADARGGKGAVLTDSPVLAGRLLSLTPSCPGIAASARLEDGETRRLTALAGALIRPGEGLRLHAAAAGRGADELAADLAALRDDWAEIERQCQALRAPALVWRPDPLARLLAAHPQVMRVVVDDAALLAQCRHRVGAMAVLDAAAIADAGLDDAFDAALDPVVALPCGGRLIIEPTAALTAIDVDSGGAKPAEANRQAVDAVARQLRLRGIAGQVAVDFIPGTARGALFKLTAALKRAVADDPVPTHVFGLGPLGLVELTRERRAPPLAELMGETARLPSVPAAAVAR